MESFCTFFFFTPFLELNILLENNSERGYKRLVFLFTAQAWSNGDVAAEATLRGWC